MPALQGLIDCFGLGQQQKNKITYTILCSAPQLYPCSLSSPHFSSPGSRYLQDQNRVCIRQDVAKEQSSAGAGELHLQVGNIFLLSPRKYELVNLVAQTHYEGSFFSCPGLGFYYYIMLYFDCPEFPLKYYKKRLFINAEMF